MRQTLRFIATTLLAGLAATIVIAWGSAFVIDLSRAPTTRSGQSFDGHVQWGVQIATGPAGVRATSRRERGVSWSNEQLIGPPDTPTVGDHPTAWASLAQDNQPEWIELDFADAVEPVAIHIYESYNPGAVVKASLFDANAKPRVVWTGRTSPTTQNITAAKLLKLPVSDAMATRRVRIDLDSPAVPGWNEIDAVGLEDRTGQVHWAINARSSSTYASQSGITDGVSAILPGWANFDASNAAFRQQTTKVETSLIEGRGWPMVAVRTREFDAKSIAPFAWRPVWTGLLINSAVNGTILIMLWWLATFPARFVRESVRLRRGCCMNCGYDLQFDFPTGCPECGWRRAAATSQSA